MGNCLTTLGISRIPCPVSLAGPLGRVASPSCHDCPSSAKADPADESHDAGRLVFVRQSTTTTSPSSIIPCRDIPWPDETVSRFSNFSMPLLRFSFVPIRQSQTKGSARRFAHAFGVPRPASGRDRGANNDARRQCCHADAALARCHLALTLTLTLTLTTGHGREHGLAPTGHPGLANGGFGKHGSGLPERRESPCLRAITPESRPAVLRPPPCPHRHGWQTAGSARLIGAT